MSYCKLVSHSTLIKHSNQSNILHEYNINWRMYKNTSGTYVSLFWHANVYQLLNFCTQKVGVKQILNLNILCINNELMDIFFINMNTTFHKSLTA